jgi:predicted transcriptional regulator of viral defense system
MEFLHTYGVPGRWFQLLFDVAARQYGYVTSEDVRELGGSRQVLVDMERHGHLERRGHGLYRFTLFPPGPHDDLMEATLWPRRLGVISHDSALDLWDLCDVNPSRIHLTVPKSARIRRKTPPLYRIYERDLSADDVGVEEGIPVVVPRRAILDGIERHLDRRLIDQAIDTARGRGSLVGDEIEAIEEALT